MSTATTAVEAIAARLVDMIEAGPGAWRQGWADLTAVGTPTNATTGNTYRGLNTLLLWGATLDARYPSAHWATYRQWKNAGGQVRKGEHGTQCIRWVEKRRKNADANDDDITAKLLIPVAFTVFNAAQVDGVELPDAPARLGDIDDWDTAIAEWFDQVPARVEWGHNRAAYKPTDDVVVMPHRAAFDTETDGWATLAHELAHWTGHRDRLARTFGATYGDDAYSVEELTAELSGAFTCAALGIDPCERPDHAAYLAVWCKMLRETPRVLYTVTARAQAATDLLASYQPAPADDVEAVA